MIKGYEAKNQTIAHGSKSTGNQNNTNPQLELKILREAYADPTLGHIAISNKTYEETGQHISDLVVRKFFSESNLQNREKRYQAYDDGTLLKMIEETQAKIQAEKNQMSAQTN